MPISENGINSHSGRWHCPRILFVNINFCKYEGGNMPSNGKKEPQEILKDKFRSIFSPKDPGKRRMPYLPRLISASGIS
jgi:hypothetical protein